MGTSEGDARSLNSRALPTLEVLLFDVYGTLSDMSRMGGRFVDVGAPAHLAPTWLTTLVLDGFALTAARAPAHFTQLAVGTLRTSLTGLQLNREAEEAIAHIMGGFDELAVQSDVPAGLAALTALGPRLVTLSNGEVSVAEQATAQASWAQRALRTPAVHRGCGDLEARTGGLRLRRRSLPLPTGRDDAGRGPPRGTSTEPTAPAFTPHGSTGPALPTPSTSTPPPFRPGH